MFVAGVATNGFVNCAAKTKGSMYFFIIVVRNVCLISFTIT